MELSIGDRVRIMDESHWAKGATGIIEDPPELARCVGPGWNEHTRTVVDENGEATLYWVRFDTPQNDPAAEGGPYEGSEVDVRCLQKL